MSAQSGWNTETTVTWNVSRTSKVCGSSTLGWLESAMAETHAY